MLIHNAGHMVTGPAEAFTPEQTAELYDTNVLGNGTLGRNSKLPPRSASSSAANTLGESRSGMQSRSIAPHARPWVTARPSPIAA